MVDRAGGDSSRTRVAKGTAFARKTFDPAHPMQTAVESPKVVGEGARSGADKDPSVQADAKGASFEPMEAEKSMTFSREELDAKLAANEARLETVETRAESRFVSEFARLEKRIDAGFAEQRIVNARIETALAHTATTRGMITTVISGAAGVFVALLSVLALAGNRFDAGMNLMGSSIHDIEMLKQKQAETDRAIIALQARSQQQMAVLSDKLDVIIKSIPKP